MSKKHEPDNFEQMSIFGIMNLLDNTENTLSSDDISKINESWQRSKRLLTICLFGILSIAIRLIKLKHQSKNLLYCQKPFLWIRLARFSVLHIRK